MGAPLQAAAAGHNEQEGTSVVCRVGQHTIQAGGAVKGSEPHARAPAHVPHGVCCHAAERGGCGGGEGVCVCQCACERSLVAAAAQLLGGALAEA